MTKAECIAKAADIRSRMDKERETAIICAMVGITNAWDIYNQMAKDAKEYEWLASLHPKTRSAHIRGWAA
jgi:hypothetical protein